MSDLANELLDQLQVKTAFTIPIGQDIEIAESVVAMWFIMAALIIISLIIVHVHRRGEHQRTVRPQTTSLTRCWVRT